MSLQPTDRVWVIGGGFLGSKVATACRAAGARVLVIDPAAPADVCGALSDSAVLEAAEGHFLPTHIFCCMATRGGSVEQYRECYLATVQSLSARVPSARIVFCSSISVYGDCGNAVITEQTQPAATTERAAILLEAEQVVLAHGGCVARLAALYDEDRCELRRRHLAREPRLPGPPQRMLHYVHVQDAASALLLLATLPQGGVYHVCGTPFSKQEAYAALAQETGLPPVEEEAPPSCRGMVQGQVSSALLQSKGWYPRPFFR